MQLITISLSTFIAILGSLGTSTSIDSPQGSALFSGSCLESSGLEVDLASSATLVRGSYSKSAESNGSYSSKAMAISMAKTAASNLMYAHARDVGKHTRNKSYGIPMTWKTRTGYRAKITIFYDLR